MASLITERFDYKKLKRCDLPEGRRYVTPDGEALPSVTTILSATGDKSHLEQWRKRVGREKAQQITQEAAGVGSRMHNYLEKYILEGEWQTPGSNPYAQQANKMAERIRDEALIHLNEIWGSEVPLYYPGIYAGTTDLVGVYKDKPAIMDFKQSNRPKKTEWVDDYRLQLVSYILCHNEVYDTDINEGHIFMCSRDFTYQHFSVEPCEFDYWVNEWWERVYKFYENLG